MKFWSAIVVDLFVAVVEMMFAWSVLYYAITYHTEYSFGFLILSLSTAILWVVLLSRDLLNLYENLGDKHE